MPDIAEFWQRKKKESKSNRQSSKARRSESSLISKITWLAL